MKSLFYGQIRPVNYKALFEHYGHEPPWPMDRSPHMSLVGAIIDGTDPSLTPYHRYIYMTHGKNADSIFVRQVSVVRKLLIAKNLSIEVEHRSVLDGNHRCAVHLVTGKDMTMEENSPYQTLVFPDIQIQGRRPHDVAIDYDFTGKIVADIGCAQGMKSIYALQQGAARVLAFDKNLRSTTWQLRDAHGYRNKMNITPMNVDRLDFSGKPVDVVMAMSVIRYIDARNFERLIRGRDCIFETHYENDSPPDTGHRWDEVGTSVYSCEKPNSRRRLFVGVPR